MLDKMMDQWRGPIAAAILVPFPRGTQSADLCRAAVMGVLERMVATHEAPFHVSLLYSVTANPMIPCDVDRSGVKIGAEPWTENKHVVSQFYTSMSLREFYAMDYPINQLRNLAWDAVRVGDALLASVRGAACADLTPPSPSRCRSRAPSCTCWTWTSCPAAMHTNR